VRTVSSAAVRLIVNADDFGLTPGINRGVIELAEMHALSSTTLMANGSAFGDAIKTTGKAAGLDVGCHVVVIDGSPISSPADIPTLLQKNETFRDSLARFATELQRGRVSEKEIEAEAIAQIQRLQSAGLRVTHVDTHKHTHLFPRVARPLMRAAVHCGVPAIRNPFEQSWSASLTRGALLRKMEVAVLRNFQSSFHKVRRAAGLKTTDGSIGVSATGHLDEANLARLLKEAPEGTWELVCHPGYNDADLDAVKTRLRGTRDIERDAIRKLIPEAVRSGRVQLIGFGDL
jgi:predicted glycoside hydrolase/deacetylase ChbG (UPF0249 family)